MTLTGGPVRVTPGPGHPGRRSGPGHPDRRSGPVRVTRTGGPFRVARTGGPVRNEPRVVRSGLKLRSNPAREPDPQALDVEAGTKHAWFVPASS